MGEQKGVYTTDAATPRRNHRRVHSMNDAEPWSGCGTGARQALELHDILSLQTLGALDQFEFHGLSLIEGTIAIALDGAEVDENIVFTLLPGDEAESLGVIEPLYRAAYTICHTTFLGLSFCFYYALSAAGAGRDWKSLLPR